MTRPSDLHRVFSTHGVMKEIPRRLWQAIPRLDYLLSRSCLTYRAHTRPTTNSLSPRPRIRPTLMTFLRSRCYHAQCSPCSRHVPQRMCPLSHTQRQLRCPLPCQRLSRATPAWSISSKDSCRRTERTSRGGVFSKAIPSLIRPRSHPTGFRCSGA